MAYLRQFQPQILRLVQDEELQNVSCEGLLGAPHSAAYVSIRSAIECDPSQSSQILQPTSFSE